LPQKFKGNILRIIINILFVIFRMKKYLSSGILVLGLAIFLLANVAHAAFEQNLRVGARGTSVVELQNELIDEGFLTPGRNTGFFGPATLQAVKDYQKDNSLPPTGYVGPLTRQTLATDATIDGVGPNAGLVTVNPSGLTPASPNANAATDPVVSSSTAADGNNVSYTKLLESGTCPSTAPVTSLRPGDSFCLHFKVETTYSGGNGVTITYNDYNKVSIDTPNTSEFTFTKANNEFDAKSNKPYDIYVFGQVNPTAKPGTYTHTNHVASRYCETVTTYASNCVGWKDSYLSVPITITGVSNPNTVTVTPTAPGKGVATFTKTIVPGTCASPQSSSATLKAGDPFCAVFTITNSNTPQAAGSDYTLVISIDTPNESNFTFSRDKQEFDLRVQQTASVKVDGKIGAAVKPGTIPYTNHVASRNKSSFYDNGWVDASLTVPIVVASTTTTLPAGCPSASGYSAVNGEPCFTFPAGCTTATGYSSVTGEACVPIPLGCTTATGYSSINGAACTPTTQKPTVSLSASPNPLPAGQTATLKWDLGNNPTSCTLSNSAGWSGTASLTSPSTTLMLPNAGAITYSVSCNNSAGTTKSNDVTVTWTPVVPGVPQVTLDVFPTSGVVNAVNPILKWTTTNNPSSCSITGDWADSGADPRGGSAGPIGVLSVVKVYTYNITCTNSVGTSPMVAKTITVTAAAGAPVITKLTATPSTIISGASTKIEWDTQNAASCEFAGNTQGGAGTSGTSTNTLTATTTFTLVCRNTAGTTASKDVAITVTPAGPTPGVTLTAAPDTLYGAVGPQTTSTLTWSATNSTSCTAPWTTSTATSGSQVVNPTVTTTYTITCTGAGGTKSAQATVTWNAANLAPGTAGMIVQAGIDYPPANQPAAYAMSPADVTWTITSNSHGTFTQSTPARYMYYSPGQINGCDTYTINPGPLAGYTPYVSWTKTGAGGSTVTTGPTSGITKSVAHCNTDPGNLRFTIIYVSSATSGTNQSGASSTLSSAPTGYQITVRQNVAGGSWSLLDQYAASSVTYRAKCGTISSTETGCQITPDIWYKVANVVPPTGYALGTITYTPFLSDPRGGINCNSSNGACAGKTVDISFVSSQGTSALSGFDSLLGNTQPAQVVSAPANTCAFISKDLDYKAWDENSDVKDVTTLQQFLKTKGYLDADATGYYGMQTMAAVRSFQKANGLTSDGLVGFSTRSKIKALSCN
jgi:peptidoglycan hydrolase-like protein with peptidoglycan-binding domain